MTDASDVQNTGVEDEKYARYRRTVLEFVDGGPRIDLRRPVEPDARRALAERGLATAFSVLTAENPLGENEEDAPSPQAERSREQANLGRTATLLEELRHAGVRYVRVDGISPDGEYRERCVAVPRVEGDGHRARPPLAPARALLVRRSGVLARAC